MNKKAAEQKFRQEVMPTIKQEEQERGLQFPDRFRRKQYWDMFLEIMVKKGELEQEKADTWTTPMFCNPVYDQAIRV